MIDTDQELDRQREELTAAGMPSLAGISHDVFHEGVEALRPALRPRESRPGTTAGVPFVLVVSGDAASDMVAAEKLLPLLRLDGGAAPGVLDRNHGEQGLAPYRPIETVGPPPDCVYAVVDVERGDQFRGVAPQDALPRIYARDRTPLTILEGIALVLLHPYILEKNACFMLAGSRRGDRRVPAIWISGKAPKLGWCWDGNPHSWLGVASTGGRVAPAKNSGRQQ